MAATTEERGRGTGPGSGFAFTAEPLLAASFLGLILLGGLVLWLPFSAGRGPVRFLDALFTATSAVCVTGLTPVDPGTSFSRAGQAVILLLIQLGGLGIMTFSAFFGLILSRKVSLRNQILIQSALNQFETSQLGRILLSVLLSTLLIELAGAAVLFGAFHDRVPGIGARVFAAVFHSVSAFCNAGFSTFPDNLAAYKNDPAVNITVMLLIVLGGIGFFVMFDLWNRLFRRRGVRTGLSLHTKIVVRTTILLVFGGAALIGLSEVLTKGFQGGNVLSWFFLSVTSRTAGFNTTDLGLLHPSTAIVVIVLMFIGGASGSTAGGVKVTTAAILWYFLVSRIRNRRDVEALGRRIDFETVNKAFVLVFLALAWVVLVTLALSFLQRDAGTDVLKYLFETVSAFGTVGLSMNATPGLSDASKALVMLTMFIGRVGPLTLVMSLAQADRQEYRFPEEKVNIG